MKINKKNLKYPLIIISLILAFGLIYKLQTTSKDIGYQPLEQYEEDLTEYYDLCPMDNLFWTSRDDISIYKIQQIKCSANESDEFRAENHGEEAIVEIYTKDFEAGKKEFRSWLKDNGLIESEILRVSYTHKPTE